ncbi:MAG: alpha/beta fold hydrolase [Spirochaetales bacterium]|nr:alpha/beta fold hydrolase [Spirochaetales bacterium]
MEFIYSVNNAWYEGVYKDKKEPCNAARSFSLIHTPKSNKAVLCIHGYTGYPGELTRPAIDLYEAGFDVYCPRLPGHGTSGDDFLKIKVEDLINVPQAAAKDLLNQYDEVHVLGHSMGGALALITAAGEDRLKSVAVAGPGIVEDESKLPAKLSVMKLIGFFKKRIKKEWAADPEFIMYYENAPADDEYLGSEYWSYLYPRQLAMLFKIMIKGGEAVLNLKQDVLTISGGKDEVIGAGSSEYIVRKGKGNNEHLHLKNATHYMFYDKDKSEESIAVETVLDWFGRKR